LGLPDWMDKINPFGESDETRKWKVNSSDKLNVAQTENSNASKNMKQDVKSKFSLLDLNRYYQLSL
jgi:hypothetical protein